MRPFMLCLALLSLCVTAVGCDSLTQTGGPCTYDDYDGAWLLTDITVASEELSLVSLAFTPAASSGELPADVSNALSTCLDAATIDNELLEVDATWPGTMSLITSGTCTPKTFDNYTATLLSFGVSCPEPEDG